MRSHDASKSSRRAAVGVGVLMTAASTAALYGKTFTLDVASGEPRPLFRCAACELDAVGSEGSPYRAAETPGWLQERIAELGTIRRLASGWDAPYDTQPPSPEAISAASDALSLAAGMRLRVSRVAASAEGGVVVAFGSGGRYADIEFFNSGEVAATAPRGEVQAVWPIEPGEVWVALQRIRESLAH